EAECQFELGEYDHALKLYEALAFRFHHQIEGLMALLNISHCYSAQMQPDRNPKVLLQLGASARDTRERIRSALSEMPDDAFDGKTEKRIRSWWEKWLRESDR